MPTIAVKGMVVLPHVMTHFDIKHPETIRAVEVAMLSDESIFLVTQKTENSGTITEDDLFEIGVIAKIKQVIKLKEKEIRVLIEARSRARLWNMEKTDGYMAADVIMLDEPPLATANETKAMMGGLNELFGQYCKLNGRMNNNLASEFAKIKDLSNLMDQMANALPVEFTEKQKVLEANDLMLRYAVLVTTMLNEIEVFMIRNDIQEKLKSRVDKNQREYILREQLKVIRKELGDDEEDSDVDQYLERTMKLNAPEEVKEKLKKEIKRFKTLSAGSSENAVSRTYIETLLELPWDNVSEDNTNLDHAQEILDEDHYGMEKVKERMLEFLAVRAMTEMGKSPIVCLVGPPGTGKTSIAKSIARALDKKYIRVSLGGVRDEAEIRGHRRTYVGALPGRIIEGLKDAGVKNPLMLLDEIDKTGTDARGDTASALLEVLDSEQNVRFKDHYVELPVDLSEVLFIATANSVAGIPRPLLDRMELVEVSSYTENEKYHIAREHLIPKQLEANGLKSSQLKISDSGLKKLIRSYTREAGVRNLERRIGELCRKAARAIYQDGKKSLSISSRNIEEILGKEKYDFNRRNTKDEVGIVRGLAWTSVGGDTLEIEVNIMPGKGELKLTGKLGDVMKESAYAALSYVRSVASNYGVEPKFFSENEIHIHVPEGAVPKDGPSAGITMATALLSAITGIKVRCDVAMTGEITLRGRVLPIGGLKEKLLAAKNAGIKRVCVPKKNVPDVVEVSDEIKEGLDIVFVEKMSEVLNVALRLG